MALHQNRPAFRATKRLTLAIGAGAKAEAEATRARVQAAVNFMVTAIESTVVKERRRNERRVVVERGCEIER